MSFLTSNGCPAVKGKLPERSLSSFPHFVLMQLFLTIVFLPPSLKRGLKWNARSCADDRSTVTLKQNQLT